ncbi:MAG: tRNA lysidine(34) synthetase TilS [Pyrinomonadaceae bacterium]|nr:tRNA lysidine(34) synthetase TilS [Pyrinomonadaceae bacterium]
MSLAQEKSTEGAERQGGGRRRLSRFSSRLLAEWKHLSLPLKDAHVIAAISGGADSVALLLALDELLRAERLCVSLTVAHLDHGLRASSGEDSLWVENLARRLGYAFELERVPVGERAGKAQDNLEQAARRTRYEFLSRASRNNGARIVLTAHTMDDQAETVLLRLLRGSGAEGLGGMEPVRALGEAPDVLLARPLLNWARRALTEEYCREREVDFRLDEMNEDEAFARVRVRRRLLPLMQGFNGRVVEALARTAQLLREDARALNELAAQLLEEARTSSADGKRGLSIKALMSAHFSLRRRALRLWLVEGRGDLRRLEMVHLMALERLLAGERGGRVVELPGGATVTRRKGCLFFHGKGVENEGERD